jgi:PAS domain S-box-containing protein
MAELNEFTAESALLSLDEKRRADLFYNAFRCSPDAGIIVDPHGMILYANLQAERLFGYRAEELVDRSVEVLVPLHRRDGHVADRDAYLREPITRPMGRGLPLFGRRKNGSTFPAEISLSPIDYNGVYVIASIRNLDEWIRRPSLEQHVGETLARLAGLRMAKTSLDQAVDEALDDLVEELSGPEEKVVGPDGKVARKVDSDTKRPTT